MSPTFQKLKNHTRTSLFKSGDKNKAGGCKPVMLVPATNIDEKATEYVLTMAAPGFDKEALQVNIEKNILSISASKDAQDNNCIHERCEYDYCRWTRVFVLPEDADALMTKARYKNGELIIRIPKGNTDHSQYTIPVYVY